MKGNLYFYFHGVKNDPIPNIKLEFDDGVLQNVLRKLLKTEVRIELNQDTNEPEFIVIPFRLLVELMVRRGLVPYTEGMSER